MTHRLLEILKSRIAIFDGGMGSMLIARGLGPGESPETWNLERPDAVAEVQRLYYEAGSDVVHTNSFGASPVKLADRGLEDQAERINRRAAEITKSVCPAGKLVAGDLGPTGKFLKPLGDLDPRDAEDSYRRQAEALLAGGADLISIETMYSLEETLAALRAAKSLGNVFVIASLTYNRTPKGFFTMMGDGVAKGREGTGRRRRRCDRQQLQPGLRRHDRAHGRDPGGHSQTHPDPAQRRQALGSGRRGGVPADRRRVRRRRP